MRTTLDYIRHADIQVHDTISNREMSPETPIEIRARWGSDRIILEISVLVAPCEKDESQEFAFSIGNVTLGHLLRSRTADITTP